jgi:hypothetical protein
MVYFFYTLTLILAVLAGLLLLRLRVRLEFSVDKSLMFAGLGRTGSEVDWANRRGSLKLWGRTIRRFSIGPLGFGSEKTGQSAPPALGAGSVTASSDKADRAGADVGDWLEIAPQCLRAVGRFLLGLLRGVKIEQAEGDIEAGFDEPDMTGQVFGWYQAALAAAPGLAGRVRYRPVWTEASCAATLRLCVALPLYRLVCQTILLVWRLQLRKIIRLTR